MQGQRSHLAQAKKCHERWQVDLDTMRILPQPENLFEDGSNDDNHWQTAGIGERPVTSNVDWDVDISNSPELPPDEAVVLEDSEEESRRDEDDSESTPSSNARWLERFPHQAGRGLRRELTMFESLRNAQVARGESIWGKFSDEGDWEVARWILKSGTTQASTNEFLELKKVSKKIVAEYWTY